INGKTSEEEEFEKLDEQTKKEFEDQSAIVQEHVMEAISQIKSIQSESDKKVSEWQSNVALLTVNAHINYIKANFKRNKKINKFLDDIKKDILKNVNAFLVNDDAKNNEQQPPQKQEVQKPWLNYRVNLFIDNSNREGAPVIMDSNYSYPNLFGKLEYENYYGSLKTDYTMLKPGLLHIANGGYLIMQAVDIVSNQACYETLKKVLRTKELGIENLVDQHSSMVMVSLKPEPIPLNLKVILIGNESIYQTLISVDSDFRKLFKIKVEFEDDAPMSVENINKLARVVQGFCLDEELPPLDRTAMAKIIEYASRLANDQTKLSTRFSEITQIVGEAATLARLNKEKIITGEIVDTALFERNERVQKYNERYMEMINNKTLLIDTKGFKVGEINGLTVMSMGDYSFGLPAKITANTYVGKNGIINIEREIDMSGSSHSKGILILAGYLGEMFAQDMPLSLTASLCFEQLYNGVDGDSASSTELYAILSSLSGIPINQAIAVTGSVNQKGEIQPIGGVNEKIEGFYKICKMRGLDGTHGVMIPKLNEKNLNLSNEVVQAVKDGLFHIYAISTIEQGIELLTGVPAGKKDATGRFPAGSVNCLAYAKLRKYAKISKED
ncbi:MAG: Lon protease family protein, partial [Clostridia bacterium]